MLQRIQSPLRYQSRSLACFPDKKGFALGSIEGRVAIHHVEDADSRYVTASSAVVLFYEPVDETCACAWCVTTHRVSLAPKLSPPPLFYVS
jgi:hypothetical protein